MKVTDVSILVGVDRRAVLLLSTESPAWLGDGTSKRVAQIDLTPAVFEALCESADVARDMLRLAPQAHE